MTAVELPAPCACGSLLASIGRGRDPYRAALRCDCGADRGWVNLILAGFGTSTSSPQSWSVIASLLAHDDAIQAALHEEDERRIRASAPRAIRALTNMIEEPEHKDHCRAVSMVLDRVHPAATEHRLTVEQSDSPRRVIATEQVLARIEQLAARAGLLLPPTAPPAIDGEFSVVDEAAA